MPEKTIPFARWQLRYHPGRSDLRGHEEGKEDRPWLVLSGRRVEELELGIFQACSVTTAGDRTVSTVYLEPPDKKKPAQFHPRGHPGFLDTQQLWTFSTEQDTTIPPVPSLAEGHRFSVTDRISRHLHCGTNINVASNVAVGSVVWVELLAGTDRAQSDLLALHTLLRKETGVDWPFRPTRLPCVVIASNLPERSAGNPTYELITVVPVVHAPAYQNRNSDNPFIELEGVLAEDGKPLSMSILTQVLLTVDYREQPWIRRNGKRSPQPRRVFFDDGPVQNWRLPPAMRTKMLEEIQTILGGRSLRQSAGTRLDAQARLALRLLPMLPPALPDFGAETSAESTSDTSLAMIRWLRPLTRLVCAIENAALAFRFASEMLHADSDTVISFDALPDPLEVTVRLRQSGEGGLVFFSFSRPPEFGEVFAIEIVSETGVIVTSFRFSRADLLYNDASVPFADFPFNPAESTWLLRVGTLRQ